MKMDEIIDGECADVLNKLLTDFENERAEVLHYSATYDTGEPQPLGTVLRNFTAETPEGTVVVKVKQ